ncbi:MAG TPA: Bax inhibitor-1 family protein [Kofleriaceae bacterium]|nr:Bax inhibitor-1 family protein [Kofleriaceae bacterium]
MADRRPIRGAVATLGVSERVAFLRRTYAHLGAAVVIWAVATALFMKSDLSLRYMAWVGGNSINMLLVFGGFMIAGWAARSMAMHGTSKTIQYAGLALEIAAYTLLTQPILWYAYFYSKSTADFNELVLTAALLTGLIFVGLTLTVFITKKDFSFLRGILMVCSFAALGVILASFIFGFQLGAIWCGLVIALMAGYILYETSSIMRDFPPTFHVAAALMLFATAATLFIYVLRLLVSLRE